MEIYGFAIHNEIQHVLVFYIYVGLLESTSESKGKWCHCIVLQHLLTKHGHT